MRWFGPNDNVSLMDIRQAGCTGVVTALHQIPVGEIWTVEAIEERKKMIEADNQKYTSLSWLVVESLPVHEDIKKGLASREQYIKNYIQSLRNLAKCGIKTVCYNFMPVLDWSRTDLKYEMPDGALALRFVWEDFAVFDLHILKRPNAGKDYSEEVKATAKTKFQTMSKKAMNDLKNTVLLGLPGSNEAFSLETFQSVLDSYKNIGDKQLRDNLYYFIQQVVPIAEQEGINLCIHPDDPPFPLLGLPRVLSTEQDIEQLMLACDLRANGLTFCTGSLGVRADNNITKIAKRFADRIHFIHLRTTKRTLSDIKDKSFTFHEATHLEGDVDMYDTIYEIIKEEKKRKATGRIDNQIPMRPDHGHQMLDDLKKKTYPGYSAIGRLKGLAELRGLEIAISRQLL